MNSPPAAVPFALPDITEEEVAAVAEVLRSGWITTGPKTVELEQRFARRVGAPHALMVNSCTAALHLALEATGVGPGDEVIVPTLTFAATAEVVAYLGARPVLVDVRAGDHNMDPGAWERAITARTRAVIPVHFGGVPCDMDEILGIARSRGVRVVDDAAHCFPCEYRGRAVGTLADVSCFSFYATKTMTTAEGGAAVTANEEWAQRMRTMSLHGLSKDAWKRYASEGSWRYEIVAPGYKYNMTDVASAMGLVQLSRADAMLARRTQIAAAYDAAFRGSPSLELLSKWPDRGDAHHLYVVKLRDGALTIDRDRVIEELKGRGIGVSVHFVPLHVHPYYRDALGYRPESCPVALDAYQRSVSLPISSRLTDEEVGRVIEAVQDVVRRFGR